VAAAVTVAIISIVKTGPETICGTGPVLFIENHKENRFLIQIPENIRKDNCGKEE